MSFRSLVSLTTVALASVALLTGCPGGDQGKSSGGSKSSKPSTAKPTGSAGATKTAADPGAGAKFGKGVIKATVKFTGEAPEMKVPKKRGEAEFCKDKEVAYNAVVHKDGKLQDVYVGLADEQFKGDYSDDAKPVSIDQVDCMYTPRIQGAMPEQEIKIKNSDATLHNVNAGKGAATLFNSAQPKGAGDLVKSFEEPGIYRLKCDVHSWMRAFVVISDNPFHGVTGADGTATINKVPDGKYKLVAWHSQYGKKVKDVEVKGGEVAVEIEFDGTEEEPAENKGELNDLF